MNATNNRLFTAFLEELDHFVDPTKDLKETVYAVRHALICALKNPRFGLACIERVLAGLEPGEDKFQYPNIHYNPTLGYSVSVFHWPSGLANAPHRHDTWTVTGVLHNSLRFNTYEIDPKQSVLMPGKRIDARSGDVGYICTPCIHNVENSTAAPSLSLHIFNYSQVASDAGEFVEYPMEGTVPQPKGDASAEMDETMREYILASYATIIGAQTHPDSLPLLDRILRLGRARARFLAVKAMAGIDPLYAADRARGLAQVRGRQT